MNSNKVYVACVRGQDITKLTATVILIGAYMILGLELSVAQVSEAFKSISSLLANRPEPAVDACAIILDSWNILHKVRCLGWINFSESLLTANNPECDGNLLDIEEYNHYADPANGGLHIIVPGRLLLIPSPLDLPDGCDWTDVNNERRFSPAFFADLLQAEFGAVLVLRLRYDDDPIEYDPSAFEDRGIAVESVSLGPRGSSQNHMLAAADRLIANLRGAPGAVVVQVQGSGAGCGGSAGVLLATGLMSVFGLGAGEAAAWLRMACPPVGVAASELSADLERRVSELAAVDAGLARSVSAPECRTLGCPAELPDWAAAVHRAVSA